ncbi:MAG: hypothetical protein R3B45_02320 [Bdellovibrionota bacterium]
MDWKKIKIPAGHRLLKAHTFMYMAGGATYRLEVDEYADGKFAGHGEHASDESQQLSSVIGTSVEECLQALVDGIGKKG